jgi:hypothetical protein
VSDRTELSLDLAKELVILSMVVGEAMEVALNERGIDVGRINYQENGNWGVHKPEGPYLHLHIYGRARSAKIQPFGHAIRLPDRETGYYDELELLNRDDICQIRSEIERVAAKRKYLGQISLQERS